MIIYTYTPLPSLPSTWWTSCLLLPIAPPAKFTTRWCQAATGWCINPSSSEHTYHRLYFTVNITNKLANQLGYHHPSKSDPNTSPVILWLYWLYWLYHMLLFFVKSPLNPKTDWIKELFVSSPLCLVWIQLFRGWISYLLLHYRFFLVHVHLFLA